MKIYYDNFAQDDSPSAHWQPSNPLPRRLCQCTRYFNNHRHHDIFATIILIMHGFYRAEKTALSCPNIRLQSIVVTTGQAGPRLQRSTKDLFLTPKPIDMLLLWYMFFL